MFFQCPLHHFKYYLFLVIILTSTNLLAKNIIPTALDNKPFPIAEYSTLFIDSTSKLDISTAVQLHNNQSFTPLKDSLLGYNFTDENFTYWLQFSLQNTTNSAVNYWLNTSVYDSLSLYHISQNSMQTQHRGLLINYTDEDKSSFSTLRQNKYGFTLEIPPMTTIDYYLRIKNSVRFESNIANIQLLTFEQQQQQYTASTIFFLIFNIAFFSILFYLALFSLLQFSQNKDYAFLYYPIYLLVVIVYFWWKFEKANSFINLIFTEFPNWYYYFEIPLSISIYISYLLFLLAFINAQKEVPLFYNILNKGIIGLVIYLFLDRIFFSRFGLSIGWEIYFIIRMLLAGISLYCFYIIIKYKPSFAVYLLSGSVLVVIGSLITAYMSRSYTQHYQGIWDIPLLPVQISILIESFLFAVGLGYKSQLIEREKTLIFQNLKKEQLKSQLQQKNEAQLKQWFTNITHEFRTPLTVIKGLTAQIAKHPSQKLHERTGIIQRNADNLLHLIKQILDIAKMESGLIKPSYVQADITKYLAYIVESFHSLAHDKQLMLSFHAFPVQYNMDYEPEKLKLLLTNLLSNAIKYSPTYGTVKVSFQTDRYDTIQNDPNLLIQHFAPHTTEVAIIKISDTGIGIPKKEIPHIFHRFYRVSDTNVAEGYGLGLTLVKEIVQLLQGGISVVSELNKGTTFYLFLPVHRQAAIEPNLLKKSVPAPNNIESPAPHSRSYVNPQQATLLIVEDNADVVYYIKTCLAVQYNLLEAKNGKKALEIALKQQPDLIISDVMMPEMNGYELCQQVRKNTRTSHIPILLLTAKATQADKRRGLNAGASAYLIKPFDKEELQIRVAQTLLQRQQIKQYTQLHQYQFNKPKTIDLLQQINQVIHDNISDEQFRIPQLARALAISESQLHRKIKALTNQSTGNYIKQIRLQKAKILLETTDKSIGQIASEVGFKNQSHFTKSFQGHFKKTPSDIRK